MDMETLARLRELVMKFKKSDESLGEIIRHRGVEAFESPLFERIFDETINIVSEIKGMLGSESVLQIPDTGLKRTLINVRDNEKFYVFNICRAVKYLGVDIEFQPANFDEIRDELNEDIRARVSPFGLVKRRMEIGTIILSQAVPHFFQDHLEKIRDCYCFNFPEAASIWCRSLLEVGVRETLKRKGQIKSTPKVIHLEERNLEGLISLCRSLFEPSVIKKMENIRREVNQLLHSEDISKKKEINYLKIIKDTFRILECIFE